VLRIVLLQHNSITSKTQCDLLAQRMRYIESERNLPADLSEAVCTIMWAADRTECDELTKVHLKNLKKNL
jgi:Regulator of Vps4 activity in the MVB pathway